MKNYDVEASRTLLMQAVGEFRPQSDVTDLVFEQTGNWEIDKANQKITKIR